jgi:DNA-binding NarL/FixJ family response regulator
VVRIALGQPGLPTVARSAPGTAEAAQPFPHGRAGGTLTAGEEAVVRLMAQGYSNAGIAGGLGLSARTVECHVTRVFDKLGLPSLGGQHNRRVLAVLWWLERAPAEPATVASVPVRPFRADA